MYEVRTILTVPGERHHPGSPPCKVVDTATDPIRPLYCGTEQQCKEWAWLMNQARREVKK